jgi:bifunctional UDP-N-acetylglucosamine pyrophosphorylase / glucosamine-1-phosphate N-acetyltransferase
MHLAIVILAAGKGTRLKSKRPKVLHEIGGKTLLRHVVDAALQIVAPKDIFVVVGYRAEQVEASLAGLGVKFIHQLEQRGTGHAVQQAIDGVRKYDNLIVLSGDVPLVRPDTIAQLRDFHLRQQAAMTILTAIPEDAQGYGRVIRKETRSEEVLAIVEQKALSPEQSGVKEINSGTYAFARKPLAAHLGRLGTDNAHGEYYLTDTAALLTEGGERVVALRSDNPDDLLGANTIEEMMRLDAKLRLRNVRRLMARGVTIFQPETTVIDAAVEVGADTIIEPFVQLLGATSIGEDCRIRSYSVLENARVGNRVQIRQGCTIVQSQIHDGALIGPFANLRPESEIGQDAHIGNFVEVKKTRLGKGSKANHLAYLGDAEIGAHVNIGAGVITCNYDGFIKNVTTIGNDVFVGSDSTLVAPINLGSGSYVGAGSCITEDVPRDALALGRARQTIKPNWAKSRRANPARGKAGKKATGGKGRSKSRR